MSKKEEKIEVEFEDYIRNKLTDDEFWAWVRGWFDVESIIDMASDWDTDEKAQDLRDWQKYEKWFKKNEDKLLSDYEFDVHEILREGEFENINNFADYARGMYEQAKEDGDI